MKYLSRYLAVLSLLILINATSAQETRLDAEPIKVSGELAASETSILGPPAVRGIWNYTVSYMIPEGTPVQTGTPVLGFDTNELQTRLNDKQGELNTKQSELRRAEVNNQEKIQDLELRTKELSAEAEKAALKAELPESVLARNVFQENQLLNELAQHERQAIALELKQQAIVLQTEEAILHSEINRLQAEVDEIQGGIQRMQIKAPRNGVALHLTDHQGNKISVGDQVWFGVRAIEIPDLSKMVARLEIKERDLAQVQPGDRIRFRLDASPERQFTGTIETISKVVRTRSAQQPAMVVDAEATIDEVDRQLMRPGMRINAEIIKQSNRLATQ